MEVDPLANIILDPEEQAKVHAVPLWESWIVSRMQVDKIHMDNLKYLNQDEHKADREVITLAWCAIDTEC